MIDKNENKTMILVDSLNGVFTDIEEVDTEGEKITTWIKDGDLIRPSTTMTIVDKLESGVYTIHFSREEGMYCKKIKHVSDELFKFSDSVTVYLLNEINNFWDKAELYKQNNLIHKRGILLEGYPGTGKSSIISLLSEEITKRNGIVFKLQGIHNLSIYVDFIQMAFRKIQPDTPIITIIEDLDQYEEVESELLDFFDGKMNIDHSIILCTTNNSKAISDTFLRPSRIDLKIEVPLPSEKTRREYFKFKKVVDEDIDKLVECSDNFSLADLKELYICHYLLDYTIEDAVQKITNSQNTKDYSKNPSKTVTLGI